MGIPVTILQKAFERTARMRDAPSSVSLSTGRT
jgi:hypothetical protein